MATVVCIRPVTRLPNKRRTVVVAALMMMMKSSLYKKEPCNY